MTLPEPLILVAIILISIAATYILIGKNWRYALIALAIQYIGVFLMVNTFWPTQVSIVKMIAGWMSAAILGIAMISIPADSRDMEKSMHFGPFFRISAAIILILTIASLVLRSSSWPIMLTSPVKWGSFILISFGLLQLSLSSHPLRVIIGLLSMLSGFEVIYAALEASTLVTGLLAGVNIGLALVGAYLIIAPTMEAVS